MGGAAHNLGLARAPIIHSRASLLGYTDLSWCCSLTGVPKSLDQLVALKPLNLIGCDEFTGLPESLGQLVSLTTLNPESGSAFTGLPESLGQRGGVDDTAFHRM